MRGARIVRDPNMHLALIPRQFLLQVASQISLMLAPYEVKRI